MEVSHVQLVKGGVKVVRAAAFGGAVVRSRQVLVRRRAGSWWGKGVEGGGVIRRRSRTRCSSVSGSGSGFGFGSRCRWETLGRSEVDEACAHAQVLLEEFGDCCGTPVERLEKVVEAMVEEMEAGLAMEGRQLKMLPAFVERLPTGEESGVYYALDLGGTNFRVLRAELGGWEGRVVKQEYKEVSIPPALMVGSTEELFDFIAAKLAEFVSSEEEEEEVVAGTTRQLGFTFSFPVNQTSIASGTLIHWSKGFQVSGTVGQDVVEVLRQAIQRQGLDMEVAALVNDTVGTLAGGKYWNSDVMIAAILGTGTNACYVERAEAVPKCPPHGLPASGDMVINTEWGNFSCHHLPFTFADLNLDADTVNPGHHAFEKLISGLYLGDLVRRLLLHLAEDGGLFGDTSLLPQKLYQKFSLLTPDISRMHSDTSPELEVVGRVLKDVLGLYPTSLDQRKIVLSAIDIVSRRGARLAAAGLVAILKKIGRDGAGAGAGNGAGNGYASAANTIIAVDGGLYEHYRQFRAYLHECVEELLGEEAAARIVIQLSKDGSGIGAALLAASHSQT